MSDEQPALPRCKHDYGPPEMCPLCKAESELAPAQCSTAPVCKCGAAMRRSRRRSLNIDGWVCMGMVHDIIAHDLETARENHTKPIQVQ